MRTAADGVTQVGGAPNRAVWDRGTDFLSDLVTESCLRLDITPVALPAFAPHLKGGLERFWRFLKENGVAPLPGYTDKGRDLRDELLHANAALSEAAFTSEISAWIDFYNTEHVNSSLGCTALEAWKQDTTPLRELPVDQLWIDFLLSRDAVKVGKNGIRFRTRDYVALNGELDSVFGLTVEVRYLPHDRSFIEVFREGQHVASCYPADALRPDDQVAFLAARKTTDAAARKAFTAANRLRGKADGAAPIHHVTGSGVKSSYQLVPPGETDLFTGAAEALAALTALPADDAQGRLL